MATALRTRPGGTASIRPRRRVGWFDAVALLYGAATAVSLAAWLAFGDTWWTLLVNAATFWWALPALPLVLVALLLRRRLAVVALGLPAVLFVWSFGGLFVGSAPAAAGDLRVASYNTYVRAPDTSHVVSLVRDEHPDVLLVQEVFPSTAAAIREGVADHLPHSWFGEPGRVGGVGVVSRHPIVEVRPIPQVDVHSRPTAVVVLDVDGRRLQVVAVHLTSPCPLCGESVVERQRFEAEQRRAEMDAIVSVLDDDAPAVVGGDFNSDRRADPYRMLAGAGFRDPQLEAGSGPGFTWPATGVGAVRIDWVLVRGLAPAAAWVDPPRASDHRPVVADLAWED
ncbi:MAG: endonuclease/exonuclease/phosphatase family protein [Nitriliruptorales bacterium]